MDWNILEKHFSGARLGRYSAARGGNTALAALDYACNLQLAEAMMPLLNTVEIALRNAINARLVAKYHRADWWRAWLNLEKKCPSYLSTIDLAFCNCASESGR
ncbi:hypothetical protein [Kalamiella sp. sgz302252]|uniref:hypothetical protein n=1 Tax=Pantoea sp. sgz302252 TaxID=3341827 RepID=UPI0036D3A1B2